LLLLLLLWLPLLLVVAVVATIGLAELVVLTAEATAIHSGGRARTPNGAGRTDFAGPIRFPLDSFESGRRRRLQAGAGLDGAARGVEGGAGRVLAVAS
jgi:hypothetical protein